MGRVVLSFILGLAISACVASTFPYKYYALDSDSYTGTLKGPTQDQDVLMSMCLPSEHDKAPCLVMFTSAFMRLKESYMKCQVDLEAAQKGAE